MVLKTEDKFFFIYFFHFSWSPRGPVSEQHTVVAFAVPVHFKFFHRPLQLKKLPEKKVPLDA